MVHTLEWPKSHYPAKKLCVIMTFDSIGQKKKAQNCEKKKTHSELSSNVFGNSDFRGFYIAISVGWGGFQFFGKNESQDPVRDAGVITLFSKRGCRTHPLYIYHDYDLNEFTANIVR